MGKKSKKRPFAKKAPPTNHGEPPPRKAKTGEYAKGDLIVLKDLRMAKYNGRRGKVVSLPKPNDQDGRY